MTDVYSHHDKAFARVAAYVILDSDRSYVGKIAFKFPEDGAGRVHCYLHVLGSQMVRGYASGCGYDKRSAAASAAAKRLSALSRDVNHDGAVVVSRAPDNVAAIIARVKAALEPDSGYDWSRELENRDFSVCRAV